MEWVSRFVRDNWLFLLFVGGLLGAWFFLRTPASEISSVDEFDQKIHSGRPVVVEFFSNT